VEYLDFEIDVEPGSDGDYTVSVLHSPAGEARIQMRFPYDQLKLRNKIQSLQIALLRSGGARRAAPLPEDLSVEQLGRDLFTALFAGDVASRLQVSRATARAAQKGIRLKLRIGAPELLGLPWEYLYDDVEGGYLALSTSTPVVRYLPLPQAIEPLAVTPPIRILGMTAGPRDLGTLDAGVERARLETALEGLRRSGVVELVWVPGETWEDLQQALWSGPWHVFHFIGHGGFSTQRGEGVIYLSDANGNARELPAKGFALLLGDHEPLRLAVLNSCDTAEGTETDVFSSTAAAIVRRGTPAVIAMQFQITDAAAIQFSRVFYGAIAHAMPVDAAVAEARKSIALQVSNTLEWGTPVLFMRSPDGVLFDIPAAAKVSEPISSAPDQQVGQIPAELPAVQARAGTSPTTSAPIRKEPTTASFWRTHLAVLAAASAALAVGIVFGGLSLMGVFGDSNGPALASPSATSRQSPSQSTTLVSCRGDLETGIFGTLNASQPTYTAVGDMCITAFRLYETTSGSGVATVKLGGATVYSVDLDNFDSIGEPGGGSGERYDSLGGRVIGVGSGQELVLDFSACVNCGGLLVQFDAAPQ
jgi:hypothetical protein